MSKLIISLSPHAHGGDSVERNMYNVLIALVPALLVSFYYFGLGSVVSPYYIYPPKDCRLNCFSAN